MARGTADLIALGIVGSLGGEAAVAGDCLQQHALYADSQHEFELAFEPVGSEASTSSHRFTIRASDADIVLDGYAMPAEPANQTEGILFYNCPEGDVTGADLKACTVWQGMIYLKDDATVDLLPAEGTAAANAILLPDFGHSLQNSTVWPKLKSKSVPLDLFTLKGCKA